MQNRFVFHTDLLGSQAYIVLTQQSSSIRSQPQDNENLSPVELIDGRPRAAQPAVTAVVCVVQQGPAVGYGADNHGPELPHSSVTHH